MTAAIDRPEATGANDQAGRTVYAVGTGHVFIATKASEPAEEFLGLDTLICAGVGEAKLTRDGIAVYEERIACGCEPITVAQAEDLARNAPKQDWCIHLIGLLDDRHYRRVGDGLWKLYRRGYGLS